MAEPSYTHLDERTQQIITRNSAERLAWLQGQRIWIPYPAASDALKTMHELIERPRHHRMRGLLFQAESNNGKSRLAQECLARHPMDENPSGDHIVIPAILLEMPPRPDENAMLDCLLEMLSQPFRRKDPTGQKRSQVIRIFQQCGLRALLVDEIQRLLGTRPEMRRVIMDALRFIANQVPVPLIVFSTPRGANALASSDEMINRLHPVTLSPWKLDNQFRSLLASYEAILPLREPSGLTKKSFAALIHTKTEGLIGEVRDLLELAVAHAFNAGHESLTEDMVTAVAWTEPSQRKRAIGVPGKVG